MRIIEECVLVLLVGWDERNVKPQCVACNVYRAGEQYKYSLYLGNNLSDELYQKSKKITKFTNVELQEMIETYSSLLKKLS
jgi:hypothetical protein